MAASATTSQKTTRHWLVAAGASILMIGASVLLSGLSFLTPFIVSELYVRHDAAGKIVTQAVNGVPTPVSANGGQAAFLAYFTIMTLAIVVALMFVAGQLFARLGARMVTVIGGILVTGGLLLFSQAESSLLFYVAGAIIGLAMASAWPWSSPRSSTPGSWPGRDSCWASASLARAWVASSGRRSSRRSR
jgi:MFS family permease